MRTKVNSTDIKKLVKKKAEMTKRCTLRGMQKSDKVNFKIMLDCMVVSPKNNIDIQKKQKNNRVPVMAIQNTTKLLTLFAFITAICCQCVQFLQSPKLWCKTVCCVGKNLLF